MKTIKFILNLLSYPIVSLPIAMAALLLGLMLCSCSTSEDPKPVFNCKQLTLTMDQAHAKWQAHVKNVYAPNYTQAYKDQWHKTQEELKQLYIASFKDLNSKCK
jgi:hypothetical protein